MIVNWLFIYSGWDEKIAIWLVLTTQMQGQRMHSSE
nr:MAG TPA: hypothetical protein [Caudoviricetes sp.]